MFYILVVIIFVAEARHGIANKTSIDPEVLASVKSSEGNKFAFATNRTLDRCLEWDKWEFSKDIREIWHYYRSGYDKDGNVVYVSEFGKVSYRRLSTKSAEVVKDFWRYYEQSVLRVEYDAYSRNGSSDGVVMIYDFDGFTLANYASAGALQLSLKMFGTLERLNKVISYGFIINANFAGESFLQLAKPYLGDALNRFEIHGTKAARWKPRLLMKIPAISLPPVYGGDNAWKPLSNNVCSE